MKTLKLLYPRSVPSKVFMVAGGIILDVLMMGAIVCLGWCMVQWLELFIDSLQTHLSIYRP